MAGNELVLLTELSLYINFSTVPCFLLRTDDLKVGTLIGEDKFGNKYFQNNAYFVGESLEKLKNYSDPKFQMFCK